MSTQKEKCPTCGHTRSTYRRPIPKGALQAFVLLANRTDWVHIRAIDESGGGELAKYRYWDLVEEKPNVDHLKTHSGLWRVTALGAQFAAGLTRVRSHAEIREGQCTRLCGLMVSIRDVWAGAGFDIRELMSTQKENA